MRVDANCILFDDARVELVAAEWHPVIGVDRSEIVCQRNFDCWRGQTFRELLGVSDPVERRNRLALLDDVLVYDLSITHYGPVFVPLIFVKSYSGFVQAFGQRLDEPDCDWFAPVHGHPQTDRRICVPAHHRPFQNRHRGDLCHSVSPREFVIY
ncbi:hypothetical protein [Halosimplex amylolyticum]|uniref:hypothetical protein n=1 Tax=Halosimplex amylolyticum TaxID=3396616 RepID=UPI003F54EE1C